MFGRLGSISRGSLAPEPHTLLSFSDGAMQ